MKTKKAIILLSGGLDSATTLAIAKSKGYKLFALTFDYNQRHKYEISSAKKICDFFSINDHIIYKLDLKQFGGSALTSNMKVPKNRKIEVISKNEIPITYVPARNTIFLSIALALAEVKNAFEIFIGVNAIDYSGYPDCRPEFIKAFEKLANLATKAGVKGKKFKIHTPLINLTKSQIIKKGIALGIDYSLTTTCYSPKKYGKPCKKCDACILRQKGFENLNIKDPLLS